MSGYRIGNPSRAWDPWLLLKVVELSNQRHRMEKTTENHFINGSNRISFVSDCSDIVNLSLVIRRLRGCLRKGNTCMPTNLG